MIWNFHNVLFRFSFCPLFILFMHLVYCLLCDFAWIVGLVTVLFHRAWFKRSSRVLLSFFLSFIVCCVGSHDIKLKRHSLSVYVCVCWGGHTRFFGYNILPSQKFKRTSFFPQHKTHMYTMYIENILLSNWIMLNKFSSPIKSVCTKFSGPEIQSITQFNFISSIRLSVCVCYFFYALKEQHQITFKITLMMFFVDFVLFYFSSVFFCCPDRINFSSCQHRFILSTYISS